MRKLLFTSILFGLVQLVASQTIDELKASNEELLDELEACRSAGIRVRKEFDRYVRNAGADGEKPSSMPVRKSTGATVNGIPIENIDVKYMQIRGTSKFMSSRVNVEIFFGQHDKFFETKDTQVRDANNRPVTFNSMIDALNFMYSNGFEFVDSYVITVGNQNAYHYMLKKTD